MYFVSILAEAYRNQTAKMISAINYISDYCNGAKLVIRLDDDVLVHPEHMLRRLTHTMLPSESIIRGNNSVIDYGTLLSKLPENTIVCRVLRHRWIIRCPDKTKKCLRYAVSNDTLPRRKKYPDFCAGFFIAFTPDLMTKFQGLFAKEKPFWIDDSYLGVLQLRLRTRNINSQQLFFTARSEMTENLNTGVLLAVHLGKKYSKHIRNFPIEEYLPLEK